MYVSILLKFNLGRLNKVKGLIVINKNDFGLILLMMFDIKSP